MPLMKKSRTDEEPENKKLRKEKDMATRGKRKKGKEQKQLAYNKTRKELINMENGLRTMNISSMNPDSMEEDQMQRDILKDLTRNTTHIAAIQETHIIHDRDYLLDNYRIITAASAKSEETGVAQGGTAIMIHGSIHQYITQIARRSSRVLRATLGRYKS